MLAAMHDIIAILSLHSSSKMNWRMYKKTRVLQHELLVHIQRNGAPPNFSRARQIDSRPSSSWSTDW
jgi:hypothetical protein